MESWTGTWSSLFFVAGALSIVAVATWWIVRYRRLKAWFPMVRILEFPQTKLPKFILRQPPLVPFLLFTIGAIAFSLWTGRPRTKIFVQHEPNQTRTHIFVDMSPSVSAYQSLLELSRKAGQLWYSNHEISHMTLGTSHSDAIYEVQSSEQVENILQGLGYHRAGVRIGNALNNQLSQTGDIDRLLVMTDRDQHSWAGFQWQFLQDSMDVFFVNVDPSSDGATQSNVFINGIRRLSSLGSLTSEWEVDLAQGGRRVIQEGTLRASFKGETLATTQWKLKDGASSVRIEVAWPSTKMSTSDDTSPILWEITPQGSDAIALDNEFRSSVAGRSGNVTIVSEPIGELALEDPAMSIADVLKVMGIDVAVVDHGVVPQELKKTSTSESQKKFDIAILLGGLGRGLANFCQKNLSRSFWIIPWGPERTNFEELCECVSFLQSIKSTDAGCHNIQSRDQWIRWLSESGGKQMGGAIGENEQSIAMHLPAAGSQPGVLAFTTPLFASKQIGISHGSFPLLIRDLIQWSLRDELETGISKLSDWLREPDISKFDSSHSGGDTVMTGNRIASSNVPQGESLLTLEPLNNLPPPWSSSTSAGEQKLSGRLDAEDPLPWIQLIAFVVLSILLIEFIWNVRRWRKKASSLTAFIFFAFFLTPSEDANAQVQITYLGVNEPDSTAFSSLTREVTSRTSIEFFPKPLSLSVFDETASEQPWLWIRNKDRLVDSQNKLLPQAIRWLKRGGFLVIESNSLDDTTWEQLLKPLETSTFRPTGWQPVPQDHELMRSFYLLDSLPTCGQRVWKWYGFDGRLAIVKVPFHLISYLRDQPPKWACEGTFNAEMSTRVFINTLMVALTTDYKRDQIHLPEILKRLRTPL